MALNFGGNLFPRRIEEALTDQGRLKISRIIEEGDEKKGFSNTSNEVVYTVPAGKVFYLFGLTASGSGTMVIRDFDDSNMFYIESTTYSPPVPFSMTAGQYIIFQTPNSGAGSWHGYEVNA